MSGSRIGLESLKARIMPAEAAAALIAPAALWLFFFLVLPFIAMLVFSFGERGAAGGYQPGFTLERQEINGRSMRYSVRSYSADEPEGERYQRRAVGVRN